VWSEFAQLFFRLLAFLRSRVIQLADELLDGGLIQGGP
jgi:hypothetical protein